MKTIMDLVKHENVRVEMVRTWLVWDERWQRWDVYHAESFRATSTGALVIATSDEAEAVAAFVKAAGLEDE